jgi:magnesium transporter
MTTKTFGSNEDGPQEGGAHGVWIDLLSPNAGEIGQASQKTGLRIPTRDDLEEIETSSRTYVENGAIYISLPLVARHNNNTVTISPIGFILSPDALVTLRFGSFKSFDQIQGNLASVESPSRVLVELVDAIVDRLADIAEHAEASLDRISNKIFAEPNDSGEPSRETLSMRGTLRQLGGIGNLISGLRSSLHGLMRMIPYVIAQASKLLSPGCTERLGVAKADVSSLVEFETHLSDKMQFLLDATLGFINIAQNEIFRVLTVASVIGIPPTLLAGIWGMNFKNMPELGWGYGYAISLGLILLSALIPALWFKVRGWL